MGKSLRMVHASGNTFMSLAKTKEDVGHILSLSPAPLWLTITEAAEPETLRAINSEIRRAESPYNLLNPDNGDVAFLIHHDARLKGSGGPVAIPAERGPAREGGHGARCNSWMELHWQDEVIFVNGCHFVTRFTNAGGHDDRAHQQEKQADRMGQQMAKQAMGRKLAIGSGDLNGQLPNREDLQRIFDNYNMTTTAKESGVMTGTHGNSRLDYVWTLDKDRRVSVEDMKVMKSKEINSDHDPIVVDLTIR